MPDIDRTLADRTLVVSGASRGIGLAIALEAARHGANVVLLAKTAEPHPKLKGTVFTAAEEIEAAGGKAGLFMARSLVTDSSVETEPRTLSSRWLYGRQHSAGPNRSIASPPRSLNIATALHAEAISHYRMRGGGWGFVYPAVLQRMGRNALQHGVSCDGYPTICAVDSVECPASPVSFRKRRRRYPEPRGFERRRLPPLGSGSAALRAFARNDRRADEPVTPLFGFHCGLVRGPASSAGFR